MKLSEKIKTAILKNFKDKFNRGKIKRIFCRNLICLKNIALQARIHSRKSIEIIRAYFAFFKGKRLAAGLTVEASLILPIVLFMGLSLIAPMKMMNEKRILQNEMEAAAKDMIKAAYIKKVTKESGFFNKEGAKEGGFTEDMAETIGRGVFEARILTQLDYDMTSAPVFIKAETSEDGIMDYILDYRMKFPFKILGISDAHMQSRVRRRLWTGSEGGRGREEYSRDEEETGQDGEDDKDNIIVYVGKTGTRYHMDRNCHYISNKLKAVNASDIENLRNDGGGKYRPCSSCKPGKTGTVYILSSGNAYHSRGDCKSLASYVKEVKLKDAAYLGPCSYCCKKQ